MKVEFDYISDLHIDFHIRQLNPSHRKFKEDAMQLIRRLHPKSKKNLIIAGDLGHYNAQDKAFLLLLKNIYEHIILVRGNHDMYLLSNQMKSRYKMDSMNRVRDMQSFCVDNGIDYLDGNVINIDGVTIGGVGMTWDGSFYLNNIDNGEHSQHEIRTMFNDKMSDPIYIYDGRDNVNDVQPYSSFSSRKFGVWNQRKYLGSEVEKLQSIPNVDVMISHYPPLEKAIAQRYMNSSISTFYVFDGLSHIKRINPKVWVFGHIHDGRDFYYKDTRFLCNPLGYPDENNPTQLKTFVVEK